MFQGESCIIYLDLTGFFFLADRIFFGYVSVFAVKTSRVFKEVLIFHHS